MSQEKESVDVPREAKRLKTKAKVRNFRRFLKKRVHEHICIEKECDGSSPRHIAPINQLPSEVLGIVFELAVEDESAGWPPPQSVLSRVCKRWRTILTLRPSFWRTFVAYPNITDTVKDVWLERARGQFDGLRIRRFKCKYGVQDGISGRMRNWSFMDDNEGWRKLKKLQIEYGFDSKGVSEGICRPAEGAWAWTPDDHRQSDDNALTPRIEVLRIIGQQVPKSRYTDEVECINAARESFWRALDHLDASHLVRLDLHLQGGTAPWRVIQNLSFPSLKSLNVRSPEVCHRNVIPLLAKTPQLLRLVIQKTALYTRRRARPGSELRYVFNVRAQRRPEVFVSDEAHLLAQETVIVLPNLSSCEMGGMDLAEVCGLLELIRGPNLQSCDITIEMDVFQRVSSMLDIFNASDEPEKTRYLLINGLSLESRKESQSGESCTYCYVRNAPCS